MYKAGDFTNGKMNEIFKEAQDNCVEIQHKQFGLFQMLPIDAITPREASDLRVVPLLFKILDSYHLKYENFYAHCAIFEGEEEISTTNIVSYIASCTGRADGQYFPYSALQVLYCTYEDVDHGILNEIYHAFIDDMAEELAVFSASDNPLDLVDFAENAIFKKRIEDYIVPIFNTKEKTIDDLCAILVSCYTTLSKIFPLIKLHPNGYSFTFNFKYQSEDSDDTLKFLRENIGHRTDEITFINNRIKKEQVKRLKDYALKSEDLTKIKINRAKD